MVKIRFKTQGSICELEWIQRALRYNLKQAGYNVEIKLNYWGSWINDNWACYEAEFLITGEVEDTALDTIKHFCENFAFERHVELHDFKTTNKYSY